MAKSIFARTVFSTEKTSFYHLLAKACQPCWEANYSILTLFSWMSLRETISWDIF